MGGGTTGGASVLVGASSAQQLVQDIGSLDIVLSPEQQARLEAASALPMLNPYFIFELPREVICGGQNVTGWA